MKSRLHYNPQFLFIQHDPSCPPQLGAKALQRRNIDFQVVYANYENAFDRIHPSMFKGIVVLGGHMAAWEENIHPWLKDLKVFLKEALNADVPILGLCLGAQILANIIGGNNYVGHKGEFGYYSIHWTKHAEHDIFCKYIRSNGLHETMPYTHGDTFSLPQTGYYETEKGNKLSVVTLATTDTPYIAIFKVGELSYGIQAHPESDHELHKVWIALDEDAMCANGQNPDVLRNDSKTKIIEQAENGCLLHSKWFDLCLNKASNDRKNKATMTSKL